MKPTPRQLAARGVLALAAWGGSMGWQAWTQQRLGDEVAARARAGDIVMLSSVTCPYCTQARAWFNAHRVPFSECFIERDAQCAAAYDALHAPGTPVLIVRGQTQVGFSVSRVSAALGPGG